MNVKEIGKTSYISKFPSSGPVLIGILIVSQILRVGIHPIGTDWINWLREAGNALPEYSSYLSKSVFPSYLAHIIPQNSYILWWLIFLVLIVNWLFICLKWISNRFKDESFHYQLLFLMIPSTSLLFLYVGHYDFFIFVASCLIATSTSWTVNLFSFFVIGMTNPEMGLVIACNLFLLSGILQMRKMLLKSTIFFFLCLLIIQIERILFSKTKPDRIDINRDLALPTLKSSLPLWQLHFFAQISPILIGILYLLFSKLVIRDALLLIPCFLVPAIFSMIIVDGTRVGASIGTSSLIICILEISKRKEVRKFQSAQVVTMLALWLLIPVLAVDVGGELRLPFEIVINFLINN
jgi:hypothetical protein